MKLPILSNGALALGLALSACAGTPPIPVQKNEFAPPTDLADAIRAAQLQRHNGDLDGATRTLGQLMLVAPDDPRVLGEYGKVLVDKGQTADALAFLGRAIEFQPGDWMLYSAEGVAYTQAGKYQSAQVAFARALELNPEEPTVLNNEALALLQTGNLDSAENLLKRATPNAPGYARIQQNLALVQRMKESRRSTPQAPAAPAVAIAAASVPAAQPVQAEAQHAPAAAPAPAPQALATPDVAQVEPAAIAAVVPVTPQPSPVVSSSLAPPPAAPVTVANSAPREITVKHSVAPAASTLNSSAAKAKFVQIAAFLVEDQAVRAAAKLDSLGAHVFRGTSQGKTVFRVRLGPFANASEANSALAAAQMAGHADALLVTDTVETQVPNAPAVRAPSLRMSQNGGAAGQD